MTPQHVQLWVAQTAMALSGLMTHYMMHPPHHGITYLWGSLFPAMDLLIVSPLFLWRGTAVWGLLLNSFLAFFGIIMMSDLIVVGGLEGWIKTFFWENPLRWVMESMFPNVLLAAADYFVGLALYSAAMNQKTGLLSRK